MKSSLENDFAMRILDKEIALESYCSLPNLKALIELYREAIEYFEEIRSPKLWDFQERLQKIFMKPSVFKMVQEENNIYKSNHDRSHNKHKANTQSAPIIRKLNRSNTEPVCEYEKVSEDEGKNQGQKIVHRIVETQKKRTENVSSRAVTDLKSQEKMLNERLANRKQKLLNSSSESSFCSFNRSFTSPLNFSTSYSSKVSKSFYLDYESDRSAGLNAFSQLNEKIEKIMEENFHEKSEKITEIKVKYETQINELESDSGIYEEIIKEMRRQMRKEIEEANFFLDSKRKDLISAVKAELGV